VKSSMMSSEENMEKEGMAVAYYRCVRLCHFNLRVFGGPLSIVITFSITFNKYGREII
jgi:hypothetical protein